MIGLNSGHRRSRDANAVVTGAGSGIGQAFAVEIARRGGSVVVSDINESAAQRTVDVITDQGGKAMALRCDVSSPQEVAVLSREAQGWFVGPPTLVVNNAGVGAGGQMIGDTPLEDWRWTMGINLWGVVHGCHEFVPLLRAAGYGGIINVASAAAFGAAPRMAQYNVSKAGVLALSETLSAELSGTGVHVSVVCPTFVKTNILDNGRITADLTALAARLMRLSGVSATRVARTTLDAHDRGALYVVPQPDAKAAWAMKRHLPRTYTRGAGLLARVGPLNDGG
ncbi:MAG: SDR family NAD(P)-dependent oxidoreductase [Jatrophihabitans sp.]|uniref:SDR family NAD(P)-dependent oxidoreductase n=1 Tax=Jatrophihabitans sp. TaxID=1932789 RepID=UPI00390EC7A2